MIVEYLKHQGVTVAQLNLIRLDAENAEDTLNLLKPVLNKTEHLIIDLSCMDYMDSSGLGVLLNCFREINAQENKLYLVNNTNMVKTLFELVYLEKIIQVFDDMQTAMRATKPYLQEESA